MKIAEIRAMHTEELYTELERLRRHLFDLRAQGVTEKLHNPNQVTVAKRDIARVFTILTERDEKNIEQHQHHMEAVAVRQARSV